MHRCACSKAKPNVAQPCQCIRRWLCDSGGSWLHGLAGYCRGVDNESVMMPRTNNGTHCHSMGRRSSVSCVFFLSCECVTVGGVLASGAAAVDAVIAARLQQCLLFGMPFLARWCAKRVNCKTAQYALAHVLTKPLRFRLWLTLRKLTCWKLHDLCDTEI